MEAGTEGRSFTRISFPVFTGNWKRFEKNCLAEAHVAGVNEALTIASKTHQKQWHWTFAPDPRQEYIDSSDDERDDDVDKMEISEIKTRSKSTQEVTMRKSKWERFPEALAQAARYQSQRLYRYLDHALNSRLAINLR